MTIIPARVGLQQRVFPDYRAPFFDLLAKSCLQGFSLFSGMPREVEAIHTAAGLNDADFQSGHNFHFSKGKTYFYFQQGLIGWLERWQPAVLIVEANPRNLSLPSAIRWMHARHRPVIGWGLGAPSAGFLYKPFISSFDGVIAYSKKGADQYANCGIAPQRVFVAANAVASKPAQSASFRMDHCVNGKARLLFVGRLQERKQLDVLFEACALLSPELQPALTVVGDGPDRTRLAEIAQRVYPEAQFVGAKHGAELEPYFNKADLFVLPGTGGLAVQQAMAHALPVIVGQADGTQGDLVRPENGWVLADPSVATLSAALAAALVDVKKLRQMGLASYKIVSEEVNLEAMVETFAKAIKSVL
jgi:glycosyltransferase involved in cell wall biosynthesis